ncbi:MAG: hypothetical protein V7K61_05685 [Nostoc sp.]
MPKLVINGSNQRRPAISNSAPAICNRLLQGACCRRSHYRWWK